MNTQNKQAFKHSVRGTRMAVVTAIILAALILLNVGVGLLPRSLTNFVADSSDAFSISAKSKSFFKQLDEDVTIYYINDPDMTYDYNYAAKFRVMLDRYSRLSDHVKIVYVDVDDSEFISKYSNYQLVGSSLIVASEARYDVISYDELFQYYFPTDGKLISYNDLVTLYEGWASVADQYAQLYGPDAAIAYANSALKQYYGISDFYSAYTDIANGYNRYWYADAMITAATDYVTTEAIPTTYILAGHGEAELSENFTKMYLDDLSIRYFSLNLDSKGSIPDNAVTLVLNDPKTDITEKEKQLLADFIANGGSLILNTTPGAAHLSNLMELLDTYGLSATDAIVLDDSLSYNKYLSGETETGTEGSTETTTEAATEADAAAQAEETTTEATTETSTETGTEAETYPEDYLFVLPDSTHSLVAAADDIITMAMLSEIYSMYMAAYEQYQSTGNSLYQAYAQYYQQMYESYSQTERNFQMLVVGAHPITYREVAGVTVKPIVTTSDKGYLSTDPTATKHTMAVTATVTTNNKTGSIVWFGFADSYSKEVADEVYKYNYGFLYAAADYAGSTQAFKSTYTDIPAIDLGGTLDMHWAWMLTIAGLGILILPLGTLITGIVICIKRKLK